MRRIALSDGSVLMAGLAIILVATAAAPLGKADQPTSKPSSQSASKPSSQTASKPSSRSASRPASAATTSAPVLNYLLADVISWKDKKLTVKFHLDESFDKYAASQFKYPRELGLKNAKVGETYVVTFQDELAVHVHKNAKLIDPANPPALDEKSLIGKVVAVEEKAAVIEWNKDDAIRKFFSKEHVFGVGRANAEFTPGQVVRFKFGADNRHCEPFPLDPKKK